MLADVLAQKPRIGIVAAADAGADDEADLLAGVEIGDRIGTGRRAASAAVIATRHRQHRGRPPHRRSVPVAGTLPSTGNSPLWRGRRSALLRQHDLGLGHHRGEAAVAAGDVGLQHDGGAAGVDRRAHRAHRVAARDRREEIGLALDRGGGLVGREQARRSCRP